MIQLIVPDEIDKLAPMPVSVARLAGIVGDPNAGVNDVAQVLEFDQALTANLLRLANSAWSGSSRKLETVRDAVLRLGVGRVLELVVGSRVAGPMSRKCDGYALGEHELWRHSVAAALAAERLGKYAEQPIPASAFTASLLHDIGKLILNRHLKPDVVAELQRIVKEEKVSYLEAERRVLGIDHAEIGGAVARHWQFPETLVSAIEHHHDPNVEPNPVLDAVHIANATAKLIGVGLGTEEMNMQASSEPAKRLNLSPSGLESLCAAVLVDLTQTEELWWSSDNGA